MFEKLCATDCSCLRAWPTLPASSSSLPRCWTTFRWRHSAGARGFVRRWRPKRSSTISVSTFVCGFRPTPSLRKRCRQSTWRSSCRSWRRGRCRRAVFAWPAFPSSMRCHAKYPWHGTGKWRRFAQRVSDLRPSRRLAFWEPAQSRRTSPGGYPAFATGRPMTSHRVLGQNPLSQSLVGNSCRIWTASPRLRQEFPTRAFAKREEGHPQASLTASGCD